MIIFEIIVVIFLCFGAFFCVVGGIGIHWMLDFYICIYVVFITDIMGAGLVLVGFMFLCDGQYWMVLVKLGMVFFFVLLTSFILGHAFVKVAVVEGVCWVMVTLSELLSDFEDVEVEV